MSGADAAQLLPALDQASHSLTARGRFPGRVGPARLAGELWVGDRPQPRLAGAMLILADAADHTALENGDAIGPRRAVREGSPPGDAGGLHCDPHVDGSHGPSRLQSPAGKPSPPSSPGDPS